jgi:hypothetical protein
MNTEREEKETLSGFGTVNFERRKHPRIAVNLPVEYWKVNETRIRAGCTGDISEGGVLLHLPEQMEIGQELRLRLFVDSGLDFLSIEALAQVVWKDLNIKNEGGCRVGVEFLDISAKDMCNLKNFLNSLAHLKVPSGIDVPPKLLLDLGISVVKTEEASRWILMRD